MAPKVAGYKLSKPTLEQIPPPGTPPRQDLEPDAEIVVTAGWVPATPPPRWLEIFDEQDIPDGVVKFELHKAAQSARVTLRRGQLTEAWEALKATISETNRLDDERFGADDERRRRESEAVQEAARRRREEAQRLIDELE
jgi:hypothetical protein